jgi:hypothetical protein
VVVQRMLPRGSVLLIFVSGDSLTHVCTVCRDLMRVGILDAAAAFHVAIQNANSESGSNTDPNQAQDILQMSHGVRPIFL